MGRSLLVRWLIFAGCFAMLYGGYTAWRVHRWQGLATQEAGAHLARAESRSRSDAASKAKTAAPADFTLTDQQGQPFSSKSLERQVWVGSYFFTNCPAVCWRLNQNLAAWQETHPDSQVRFISISCDPENDTPEVLTRYAQRFNADPRRWTFLTGDMATIVRLGNETFQVSVEKGTHSDRAFVVDRDGKVRGRFRVTEPDQFEKLKMLLTQLDAEGAAAAQGAARPQAVGKGSGE
jgi:cytochrome oxidase Cu insertion factor (SCO1/SenC/PrrC family)